jgi:hypothetical protein
MVENSVCLFGEWSLSGNKFQFILRGYCGGTPCPIVYSPAAFGPLVINKLFSSIYINMDYIIVRLSEGIRRNVIIIIRTGFELMRYPNTNPKPNRIITQPYRRSRSIRRMWTSINRLLSWAWYDRDSFNTFNWLFTILYYCNHNNFRIIYEVELTIHALQPDCFSSG